MPGVMRSLAATIQRSVSAKVFPPHHDGVSHHRARVFAPPNFEAFAQVFDGLETCFEKLFLKPHFLKSLRTRITKSFKTSAKRLSSPAPCW